jgi:hypothetical protein
LISARYHWKKGEKPMPHILFFLLFSLISARYHWKKEKNRGDVSKDRMPIRVGIPFSKNVPQK